MKATAPFETWNCLITDKISYKIVQQTNQYILIVQRNFSHDSDAKLTDKIEIKAFFSLLCLDGSIRGTKQSLQELWGIDREGIEKFLWLVNQRIFKSLSRNLECLSETHAAHCVIAGSTERYVTCCVFIAQTGT